MAVKNPLKDPHRERQVERAVDEDQAGELADEVDVWIQPWRSRNERNTPTTSYVGWIIWVTTTNSRKNGRHPKR